MPRLKLVIGNRNYSSWSLRAWLAAAHSGLDFEEVFIPLDQPDSKEKLAQHSPSNLVPVLDMDGTIIWDSIAIIEALHELSPAPGLWPEDRTARAVARSVSAEMHSGFYRLRRDMPMDLRSTHPDHPHTEGALKDAERVQDLWADCRARFGGDGPFLFGAWSAADMMYAPVVGRLKTFGVPVSDVAAAYMDAVWTQSDMAAWVAAARDEPFVIDVLG